MVPRQLRMIASALVVTGTLVAGCSSSSGGGPGPSGSSPAVSPSGSSVAVTDAGGVQNYLDAVNKLCDALLPKIIAVTHGGSLDIPLKAFFAQLPAHQKLRDDFDRKLAQVPVPKAAKGKAQALANYIRFADQLDAARLAAAKKGKPAYAKEIRAELATAANDPLIAARNAAGFSESCDAR